MDDFKEEDKSPLLKFIHCLIDKYNGNYNVICEKIYDICNYL
jgi:hypothetical protein